MNKKPSELPAVRCAYTRLVPLSALKPNPANPNQHPEEQLRVFEKIIRHQGIRRAVVVSKESGFIVTGHGLASTLQRFNASTLEVPIDEQSFPGSTPGKAGADETAHLLADNHLPQLAELDAAGVEALTKELDLLGVDLELTGIDLTPLAPAEAPEVALPEEYVITVECKSARDQARTLEKLKRLGLNCRA